MLQNRRFWSVKSAILLSNVLALLVPQHFTGCGIVIIRQTEGHDFRLTMPSPAVADAEM